ncbi:MAG: fluoride efflux transporter CrcB [Candidatus Tokpelaia sp.]|nr:MAG: fluoride efflux transporter CrcB [Candidatus Tokpelaia sp.]KAA6207458.1 MAG: fluoride efflux transporter CrcB [Candidatus Tokpelaia sp.]
MAASLWVALGGALGSVARYWLGLLTASISRSFPWGTLFINISGSFLIAFFGALTAAHHAGRWPVSENMRLFVMVGLCGGFTTFSAFSLQNLELLRQGAIFRAFANIVLAIALCLAACALGALWAEKLARNRQVTAQIPDGRHYEQIIRDKIEEEA